MAAPAQLVPFPRGTVLDAGGAPVRPQASFGRHVRRHGAHTQAQLANWINNTVGARLAEREKRVVADRALDLYTNSAIAKGVLDGMVTEVVGTGLTPVAAPMVSYLRQTAGWSESYEEAVEHLLERWAFDPRHWCDAQRRLNLYPLQSLAEFGWRLDGIALFQVRLLDDPLRPSPLALLPIDASRLVTPYEKQGADVYDGVEVDREGAVRAVWILKTQPGPYLRRTNGDTVRVPVWHEETGLPQVLLVADVRNVAEYRQDSILSAVIPEIKTNDDLVEAALVRTMLLNLFALYVAQEVPGGGFPGVTATTDAAGNVDWSQRVYELAKGLVIEGPPGYKPEEISNSAPGPGFSDMWRSILSRVGMATQRGSETILREYNSSYSSALASVENAERFAECDRGVLNACFNQPVMSWLLFAAHLRGELPAGVSRAAFLRDLYPLTRCEFLPPPPRVIRPDVQAGADAKTLESGTDTLPDIYARRGLKWREQRRKTAAVLAYDRRLEEEFGVEMPVVGGGAPGTTERRRREAVPDPDDPQGRNPEDEKETP